ncbi:MAG: hypothetical protein RMK52_07315 [Chitinophagales bacterium]|nr:hypothetical protein [Chitinophagales bacterium]MDW8394039.1 hypothetical protein [Chitinophagales bacterium]
MGHPSRFVLATVGLGIFVALVLTGCEPEAGEGGTSTLRGKVLARDYSGDQFIREYYVPEERVYLVYGDDAFYSDDVRTSYDGSYEFRYLKKGRYTVFAYSECDTCPGQITAVFVSGEITRNRSVLELPDLIIRK